jgi:hypothetical protein
MTFEERPYYAFADDNGGPEDRLRRSLVELARYGRQIHHAVIAVSQREKVRQALQGGERTIQVAHLRPEDVLPWPAVYDRPVDPSALPEDVCLAPCKSGRFDHPCGEAPACPLSAAMQERRVQGGRAPLLPEEVVCPASFWGFRHRIELPLLHAPGDPDAPPPDEAAVDTVMCGRPLRFVAGVHRGLPRADRHEASIKRLLAEARVDAMVPPPTRRALLDALNDDGVDIAYLYCRTQIRNERDRYEPALCFAPSAGQPEERITAEALGEGTPWRHRPLILLNGCSTAGLLPSVPSPILFALRDRRAAGVLGTEVEVWEPLADEMARLFLQAFLAGATAGHALLSARRALLARNNPLGLVYTLYASADLRLHTPA